MSRQSNHRLQLDILTADILNKSSAVIQCIEENIKLTHSLRLSSSLISHHLDQQIGNLNSNLQSYQSYLSQLNSLLIRSEYFEAQMLMLETSQSQNDMDNDLNWRSTEATLENLYLEFRFITKKIDAVSGYPAQLQACNPSRRSSFTAASFKSVSTMMSRPETIRKTFRYLDDNEPTLHQPLTQKGPSTLQDKTDDSTPLKPIRCGSIKRPKSKSHSSDLKSFNLLASTPVTPTSTKNNQRLAKPPVVSPSVSTKKLYQLLTPETTINSTIDTSFDSIYAKGHNTPNSTCNESMQYEKEAKMTHTRCLSLPDSETFETEAIFEPKKNANLRHFTSYETGLKIHRPRVSSPGVVKHSQFVYSPVSTHLEEFLSKPKDFVQHETPHEERTADVSIIEESTKAAIYEEQEEEDQEKEQFSPFQIPTFEHKLNRSNSCESIFNTMTTKVPIPPRDNKSQTISWMKKFTTTRALQTNISAVSVSNTTSINRGQDSKAFSSLASYARPTPPQLRVSNPEVSIPQDSMAPSPFIQQEKFTKPFTLATNSFNSFLKKSSPPLTNNTVTEPQSPRKPAPAKASTTNITPTSTNTITSDHKPHWASLFAKFNPNNLIQNPVISEVGKPTSKMTITLNKTTSTPQPTAIPIAHRQTSNSSPFIKGSFSTLKIANGNKLVQYGQSSDLGKSVVVSTRVSHGALRDALESLQN